MKLICPHNFFNYLSRLAKIFSHYFLFYNPPTNFSVFTAEEPTNNYFITVATLSQYITANSEDKASTKENSSIVNTIDIKTPKLFITLKIKTNPAT